MPYSRIFRDYENNTDKGQKCLSLATPNWSAPPFNTIKKGLPTTHTLFASRHSSGVTPRIATNAFLNVS